jgi:hypothetical protein
MSCPFSSPLPFPATFGGDSSYDAAVVYRGSLGQENGAVIVSQVCGLYVFIHGFFFLEGPPALWVGGGYVV